MVQFDALLCMAPSMIYDSPMMTDSAIFSFEFVMLLCGSLTSISTWSSRMFSVQSSIFYPFFRSFFFFVSSLFVLPKASSASE